jgi:hypothetical protein
MSRWQIHEFGARAFAQDLQTVEEELASRKRAENLAEEMGSEASLAGSNDLSGLSTPSASLDYGGENE